MEKLIVNEEDIPEIYLNGVWEREIYIDEKNLWLHTGMDQPGYKIYTYIDTAQTQWQKENPKKHILEYEGSSSKGKGIPQKKMFDAQKASSKPVRIRLKKSPAGKAHVNLIEPKTEKKDAKKLGFWEQYHILKGDWPRTAELLYTKEGAPLTFNGHANGPGCLKHDVMVSYIADEFLRAAVDKIKAGEKVSGIEEYFIPRHVLWFLDACGFRIQGRDDQESTTQGVKRITKNMKLDADPVAWKYNKKGDRQYAFTLLPENCSEELKDKLWECIKICYEDRKNIDDPLSWVADKMNMSSEEIEDICEKIYDGNTRSKSCVQVQKMDGLYFEGLPYDRHKRILKSTLEKHASELNSPYEDHYWKNDEIFADVIRHIKSAVEDGGCLTKETNKGGKAVKWGHLYIIDAFPNWMFDDDIATVKSAVNTHFKNKRIEEISHRDGVVDTRPSAIKNDITGKRQKIRNKKVKETKENHTDKKVLKSDLDVDTDRGMMVKQIGEKLKEYKKNKKIWPKITVVNIMFLTVADYEEFVSASKGNPIPKGGSDKGSPDNLKNTKELFSGVTDLYILPINPKGEKA